ncbi:MAG TPA: cysteine--tRNA ligase [Candidatus Saccharimonadales bacterium]|nr:cysteine--tRNA ligase [Candidatus Saccharimonadales bacterium]
MQLHNTLTRSMQQFEPLAPGKVGLYTCGPTVYDYQHIGNYATYIRWDTLVRTLRESGYDVNWVMNITDVGHLTSDADDGEDKLEKGAKREGKTAWEVAAFYTKDFLESLTALNVLQPTHLPKATDHIAQQITLIQELETKGHTYTIDDGVYYDTTTFADYGKLAQLDLDALKAGARVELNPQKRNPTDFALWKFTPTGEKRDMEWDSPWGKGFPGWHIECSAMSMQYLGETLDIHTGGIDHLPVHHVNEIAQSEGATGKQFSRFWLHSNHIMVDGNKISKSLQNGITLADLAAKGFSPLDVRLLFLQSHYRTSANFSLEGLEAAKQRRISLQAFADLRLQSTPATSDYVAEKKAILQKLQDDLNTPEALASLSSAEHAGEKELTAPAQEFVAFLDRAFGLKLSESVDITDEQKELIAKRSDARERKDFAAADAVRDTLLASNIALRDTEYGTFWSRTN